jgi:hypothetical protein
MANLPLILVVFAFLLTLIAAFVEAWWRVPQPGYPRFLPHPGWLGVSAYFLSILIR